MKHGKPERKWYTVDALSGAHAEIWIYEEIGSDFWGEGLTAKKFVEELAALDVEHIALHINSPGGSVFDGQAIYNALVRHPASVTTYIDGVAASIASVVALAGDTVEMAANALFMIHDPWGATAGTAADMRTMAGLLDKITGTMLDVYEAKSALDRADIAAAMSAETWYTAAEAQAAGYADSIGTPVQVAALSRFDLEALGYRHGREALAKVTTENADPDAVAAPGDAAAPAATDRGLVFVPGHGFYKINPRKE